MRRHTSAVRLAAAAALVGVAFLTALPAAATPNATCTITGTQGPDHLRGTPHKDVICGLGGNDVLIGGGGNDTIIGGPGDDRVLGGPGDDILRGGPSADIVSGEGGTDALQGGPGDDRVRQDVPPGSTYSKKLSFSSQMKRVSPLASYEIRYTGEGSCTSDEVSAAWDDHRNDPITGYPLNVANANVPQLFYVRTGTVFTSCGNERASAHYILYRDGIDVGDIWFVADSVDSDTMNLRSYSGMSEVTYTPGSYGMHLTGSFDLHDLRADQRLHG